MQPLNHPLESQEEAQAFLQDYDKFLWKEFAPDLQQGGLAGLPYQAAKQQSWEDRKLEALAFLVPHLNATLLQTEYESSRLESLRVMQLVAGDEVISSHTPDNCTIDETFTSYNHYDALKKVLLAEGAAGQRLMRHMENIFKANRSATCGLELYLHDPLRSIRQFADPSFHERRKQGLAIKRERVLLETLPGATNTQASRPRM